MRNLYRFLYKEIVYNGHLQSLGAVGIVAVTTLSVTNHPFSLALVFLVYLTFQIIYTFDRYKDIDADEQTNGARTAHLRQYLNKIPYILCGYFIVFIIVSVFYSNFVTTLLFFMIIGLGLLYPLYFKGLTKTIPVFKNLYVSSVHSLLVILPFFYFAGSIFVWSKAVLLIWIVLLEALISQFALDIKDEKPDKEAGLKTLVVLVGKKKSIQIIFSLCVISLVVSLLIYFTYGTTVILSLILMSFALNLYSLVQVKNNKPRGYLLYAAKFFLWLLVLTAYIIVL